MNGFHPDHAPLGVILAGGASRRFGAPKALARVGGLRIVERVRDALLAVVPDVVLIANEPEAFTALELPLRPDDVPEQGALGGVRTALRWAAERNRPGALCVACDMPFLAPALLRTILRHAREPGTEAVLPESRGRRGVEPLCAWYSITCLGAVEQMLAAGERRVHALPDRVRSTRVPLAEVAGAGDPDLLFLNVNTVDDHRRAERIAGTPPVVAVIGRKNSGKTTLAVALLAEMKRRGFRVASLKHGHHAFETDRPGTDSWRHFHQGEAEATLMVGTGKVALVMRVDGDPDPAALIRDLYSDRGYDLVLVEGYKHGPFPRIEVFRQQVHDRPLYVDADPDAAGRWLAITTDDPELAAHCPVVPLDPHRPDGTHVTRLADLLTTLCIQPLGDGP